MTATKFGFANLRRFHAKGFTFLWIKSGRKEPVDFGWTKAPRLSFDAFKLNYVKGQNVGVRLGKISKVEGGFLAVLDLDVKGTKAEHQAQAVAKLFELFPEVAKAPCVISGRGNGSAHYYITLSEPVERNERKGQSSEVVKVKMPSVKPSKRELETLTAEEIGQGLRLRPAWEISLLCEGRQVVFPGSVHPDSGRLYAWKPGTEDFKPPQIPLERAKGTASKPEAQPSPSPGQATPPPGALKFRPVDVESLGLRADQVAAITAGAGVTDRSASLFSLSMAMLQRKVSEADILSVFTDRKNYLGETAYDHAKTNDRVKAALWLLKYTLPRARAQVNQSAFAHEVKEEANSGGDDSEDWIDEPEAAKAESKDDTKVKIEAVSGKGAEAFLKAGDWKQELDLQPGPKGAPPQIRSSFKNLTTILLNTIGEDFIRFDDFALREFWAYDVPWGIDGGSQRSAGTADEIKLKGWLIETWGIEASLNMLTETLAWFVGRNHFHPVKDYLEGLEWDGVSRIDTAFKDYLGVKMPRVYIQSVSRKFFLALMARIYEPGCKFDHLPVLEGNQGIGKSTFGRILVGDKWFMDGLPDLADKDAALNLQGIWLCEMSELSSLYRSQLEVAKAFITRQTDKVRPPYGVRRVELPRSTIFLGTTNDRDYLVDTTGNRRFWPVLIKGCKFKKLARDREQLLAESYWCYLTEMEPLYLQGEAKRLGERIQESRRIEDDSDTMTDKFKEWIGTRASQRTLKDITRVKLHDLFTVGPFNSFPQTHLSRKQAGAILRRAGYHKISSNEGKLWVTHNSKGGRPIK